MWLPIPSLQCGCPSLAYNVASHPWPTMWLPIPSLQCGCTSLAYNVASHPWPTMWLPIPGLQCGCPSLAYNVLTNSKQTLVFTWRTCRGISRTANKVSVHQQAGATLSSDISANSTTFELNRLSTISAICRQHGHRSRKKY